VVLFDADVSFNALFLAVLTEIEVRLGFLAACPLCFPRLFKAKWSRVKETLSYGATPKTGGSTNLTASNNETWGGSKNHTGSGIRVEREIPVS
jgi:hypothetical protein